MAKLMLVDGNSLTYRAFFALPTDITLASGQVTNAVYGFTSMLLNLVRDPKPDGIAAAFDRPGPAARRPPPHARRDRRGVRPAGPDVPPRPGRRLQGRPLCGARHPAAAARPRA